jgi:hypothetical protein
MNANWTRISDGRKCDGASVLENGCEETFEKSRLAAHLSDGMNLCESCWAEYQDAWAQNPANEDCPLEIE